MYSYPALSVCSTVCIYSIFYVFYEQYLTIWTDAITSLSISLISIFTVSYVLTGFDVIAAFVILLMVLLILINMGGLMWLTNISLNAISLVNLVVVSTNLYRELLGSPDCPHASPINQINQISI